MSLPNKQKPYKVKLPTCKFCNAVGKHYSYACPQNPKNKCSYCESIYHTSLMCPNKPRKPIKQESDKTKSKRTAVSRLWFEINPPNEKGIWICYLQISPECPIKLTRSTIRLEHIKPKVRYPELKFEVTNLGPACDPCNKLKGSFDLWELPTVAGIRLAEGQTWDDILAYSSL